MQNSTKVQLELKGERIANRLRLFLTIFFTVASALAYSGGTINDVFGFYIAAVSAYLLSYIATKFWLKHNLYYPYTKYSTLFIEFAALFLVNYSFLLLPYKYTLIQAINNPGRFVIYFIFITMAGLRFSPSLVYFSGLLTIVSHASLYALLALRPEIAVVFAAKGEPDNQSIYILYLAVELLFIVAMTVLVAVGARYSRELVAASEDSKNRASQSLARLKKNVEDARLNMEELHSSMQNLATIVRANDSASQDQLVSIEETSATMEQMSASIQGVADQADRQYRLGEANSANMERLLDQVGRLKNSSDTARKNGTLTLVSAQAGESELGRAVEGIKRIESSSQEISEIVSVINEIAEKINLLALNASIEAARAGQEGRGFAVVAQEMGKLAEMSSENASRIARIILGAQKDTTAGVEAINNTLSAIQSIVTGIRDIVETVTELNDLATDQEASARNTGESSENFKKSAREIRDAARELAGGSSEIIKAIDIINAGAEKFKNSTESLAGITHSLNRILERLGASMPGQSANKEPDA